MEVFVLVAWYHMKNIIFFLIKKYPDVLNPYNVSFSILNDWYLSV